jgi:hypothetical protein
LVASDRADDLTAYIKVGICMLYVDCFKQGNPQTNPSEYVHVGKRFAEGLLCDRPKAVLLPVGALSQANNRVVALAWKLKGEDSTLSSNEIMSGNGP